MSDDHIWGVLTSQSDEDALKQHITSTTDDYHGAVASREIHWLHPASGAWLAKEPDNTWHGWDSKAAAREVSADDWTPWQQVLDRSAAPYYKWFTGGQTNALLQSR